MYLQRKAGRKKKPTTTTTHTLRKFLKMIKHAGVRGGVTNPNEVGVYDCYFIQKAKQNKELICNPIYKFTDSEVWEFIRDRKMKYNPLYDQGFKRVGCIGCPFSTHQIQELEMYPKYKEQFIRTFDKMLQKMSPERAERYHWKTGLDVYKWWIEDKSIPGQMNIFDYKEDDHE